MSENRGPPVKGSPPGKGLSMELARKAIETAKEALQYLMVGPPIIRYGPAGEVHVDVPLMYHGYAIDRVHFDPLANTPSPKGRPARAWNVRVSAEAVRSTMESIVSELRVLDAAEFREPENAWAIPIAWRNYLIAHIKVSYDGSEIIPDYGLTEEVRRYAL